LREYFFLRVFFCVRFFHFCNSTTKATAMDSFFWELSRPAGVSQNEQTSLVISVQSEGVCLSRQIDLLASAHLHASLAQVTLTLADTSIPAAYIPVINPRECSYEVISIILH
jgi:hypothetical protein